MPYQKIHENIAVAGVYQKACFVPKKFKWKTKEYWINKITLASDIKDGEVRKRFYSVVAGANVYRLEFNRDTEKWMLMEIWME